MSVYAISLNLGEHWSLGEHNHNSKKLPYLYLIFFYHHGKKHLAEVINHAKILDLSHQLDLSEYCFFNTCSVRLNEREVSRELVQLEIKLYLGHLTSASHHVT